MRQIEPSPSIVERLEGDAKTALDAVFDSVVQRQREARERSPAGPLLPEVLLHKAFEDEAFQKAYPRDARSPREQLLALEADDRFKGSEVLLESPTVRALTARPPRVLDTRSFVSAPERHLHVLGPPYVADWTSGTRSGNASIQNLSANRQTGRLGYFMGAADGAAACGTGIWAQFVPTRDTRAQARAFLPYDYQYDLNSQYGYTAHVRGGFGVFVLSWKLDGSAPSTDLDYRYTAWSDGTGWWDRHDNPSFPDPDIDHAYLYGREAPYIDVRADRVYRVCFWHFGSSDAGGGFFGNAIAASAVNASVSFVVIGEQ